MNLKYLKSALTQNPITILLSGFVVLATLYICFFHLHLGYFENWDEAWYADVTRSMLSSGNLFVLYWNKAVFLDKTPLNIWANAISSLLFGLSEFSIRFPSALSGAIIILSVYFYTLKKWGRVAAFAAFSALALNNIFVWRTRTGNMDTLAAVLILALFFVLISKRRFRLPVIGLLLGLVYLQKATLVGYPLLMVAIHEILFEWRNIKKNILYYLVAGGIFVFLAGGWLYMGSLQVGERFIQYYIFKADQGVARVDPDNFSFRYFWHMYYALQRRLFYLFLAGLPLALLKIKKREYLLILLFALSLPLQLSLSHRDNNWYLVPAMPFWAMICGMGVKGVIDLTQKLTHSKQAGAYMAFLLFVFIALISYKTFSVNILSVINTRASVEEVATARFIQSKAASDDVILRLDHSYPVTIYYSGLKTLYSGNVYDGLQDTLLKDNISWVAGKHAVVEEFQKLMKTLPTKVYKLKDETVLYMK